jgi:hypothetical protein
MSYLHKYRAATKCRICTSTGRINFAPKCICRTRIVMCIVFGFSLYIRKEIFVQETDTLKEIRYLKYVFITWITNWWICAEVNSKLFTPFTQDSRFSISDKLAGPPENQAGTLRIWSLCSVWWVFVNTGMNQEFFKRWGMSKVIKRYLLFDPRVIFSVFFANAVGY